MTVFKTSHSQTRPSVAGLIEAFSDGPLPMRVTAYDGSAAGPDDAPVTFHLGSEKGLRYMLTSPGQFGLARAYISGELVVDGVHPGDPYEGFRSIKRFRPRQRTPRDVADVFRVVGPSVLTPPPPPDIESLPRWRRTIEGLREPAGRRAKAIGHHYDVGNAFYERVLGPSMTYTCAVYASEHDSLEEAQERKYRLVADKLALRKGMRLLDVGCGWGGMVRHAARRGVRALGVTLSEQQATWAQEAIAADGLSHLAEVRHLDYRDAPLEEFDAISSIGLMEHVGVRNYPSYFAELLRRLRPGGRLLNHCITRGEPGARAKPEPFTDRYVFPDGELAPIGRVVSACHDAGFEVQHEENLRMSYAHTLGGWCRNLVENWDACVDEVGLPTARVWGLYMAASRAQFESNALQLHQVLATCPGGDVDYPLRPDWRA